MITPDQLQNELIVIAHHVEDAIKGIDEKDFEYTKKSLHDITEVVDRLKSMLPPDLGNEISRIAGEI